VGTLTTAATTPAGEASPAAAVITAATVKGSNLQHDFADVLTAFHALVRAPRFA
jgi:hypothetical protein